MNGVSSTHVSVLGSSGVVFYSPIQVSCGDVWELIMEKKAYYTET